MTALFACTDIRDVASPGGSSRGRLALAPHYALLAGPSVGNPIHRIRLTAREQESGNVVGSLITDVDPTAEAWDLGLDVSLESQIIVIVTIELINVDGGVETVQWSGVTAPITVAPTQSSPTAAPVTLYQGPPANLGVSLVTLAGDSIVVEEGATASITATVAGPTGSRVIWSVQDPAIASVDANGNVSGNHNGTTRVFAVAGPRADTARVVVTQRINSVVLSPDTQRIQSIGADAVFTARVLDTHNADVIDAGVMWSAADTTVAQHLGNGRFRARRAGVTQIFGASSARPAILGTGAIVVAPRAARIELGNGTVRLNAIGAQHAFTANVLDANGNAFVAPVTWRTSDAQVAVVDDAGHATATGVGTAEISAITGIGADTVVGRVSLAVTQTPVAMHFERDTATLEAINDTLRLHASVRDANDHVIAGAQLRWTSSSPGMVSVDSAGVVRARGNGVAFITARAGSVQHAAEIIVRQRVVSVVIQTAPESVTEDETISFSARALDPLSYAVSDAELQWTSSDTAIAVVEAPGVVRGVRAGKVVVRAAAGGVAATANLVVRARPAARIAVSPDSAYVNALGFTTLLTANVFDDRDMVLPNARAIWGSLDPAIATVDSTGTVRAVASGRARIVASINPADTAIVIVRQIPAHITLDPAEGTVLVENSVTLTAIVADSNHVAIPSSPVAWTSSDSTIARVANGLITGVQPGTATISASSNGNTAVAIITVNVNPDATPNLTVASLTILPDTLVEGGAAVISGVLRNTGNATAPTATARLRVLDSATGAQLKVLVVATPLIGPGDSALIVFPVLIDTTTAWPDAVKGEVHLSEGGEPFVSTAHVVRFRVTTVEADPQHLVFASIGDTARIEVTVRDRYERVLHNRAVAFLSTNPAVATVDGTGLVTAMDAGDLYVLVASEGRVDTVRVEVEQIAHALAIEHGDGQSGIVDQVAADSLGIRVLDARGNPVRGALVTWSPDGTSGTIVSAAERRTNANGISRASWKLGTKAGNQNVNACVTGLGCISFRANARPAKPKHANKRDNSDDQKVTVNQVTPNAVELTITDEFDNPIQGAIVNWALHAGHVAGALSAEVDTTDAAGVAGVSWNVGTRAGVVQLDYTILDEDGATILVQGSFKARARAAKAHKAHKTKGDEQDVIVNQIAPNALELTVLDEFDNPTRGTVVWTLATGRGALTSPATAEIDTITGHATVTWQLPTVKGRYSIDYQVVDELGADVVDGSFHVNAKADKPNRAAKGANSDEQTATVMQTTPNSLQLTLTDAFGNVVDGAAVHWSLRVNGNNASISESVSTTDTNGQATVTWNVGTKSGLVFVDYEIRDTDNVTVLISGSFKATAKATRPKHVNKHGDEQTGVVATLLDGVVRIEVRDTFDNAVPDLDVVWAPARGTVPDSTTKTDAAGITTAAWTLGTPRGPQTLDVTVFNPDGSVMTTVTFTANAKPGKPAPNQQAGMQLVGGPRTVQLSQGTRDFQFQQDVLDEFGNKLESQDLVWMLCAGDHVQTTCASPQVNINGLASVQASTAASTPPRARLQLLGTGQVTIVASRNGVHVGSVLVDILP